MRLKVTSYLPADFTIWKFSRVDIHINLAGVDIGDLVINPMISN